MKVGFIGLGKMGSQMVTRLISGGHEVVVFDVNKSAVEAMVGVGAESSSDQADLVNKLEQVIVWLMIPAQFVDGELETLLRHVPEQSIIIDGGNSDFRLTLKRFELCALKNVHFIDVGTSGGILGLENGFSMMIGGNETAVRTIQPIIETLARPNGWHYFGESGTGH